MATQSHPLDGGRRDESLSAAGHKGNRVSTPSLGSSTKNSAWRNSLLQRHSKENRHAESHASRSPSLRHQPGSSSDPLPPRSAPRWRTRRLPLGNRAQGTVAGDGERGWSLERCWCRLLVRWRCCNNNRREHRAGTFSMSKPSERTTAENHHPGGTGPPVPHESPLVQVALPLLTCEEQCN